MGKSTKASLSYLVRYWKWFISGILISSALAFLYLHRTTPVYKVSSSIILKDARFDARAGSDMLDFLLSGASGNVANELYSLKSRSLIRKVVDRLDLHTSYMMKKRGRVIDLYTNSPAMVSMAQSDLDTLRQPIILQLEVNTGTSPKSVKVTGTVGHMRVDTLFAILPALLPTPSGNISFTERVGAPPVNKPYRVVIQHPDAAARRYRAHLNVNPPSKRAFVLNLSFHTTSPALGMDFLNTLVETYNNETIQDKNTESINTQRFIMERIRIIERELTGVEQDIEAYKRKWGLTDFEADVQRNMSMENRYEQQLVEVETQLAIVNSFNEYINDPQNRNKTLPVSIEIADPFLRTTVSEYNRLLLERERLSQSMTKDNPSMVKLDEQLSGLRQNIITSVGSVLKELSIRRRDILAQAGLYGGRIGDIPVQEREFLEISREQRVKSRLFLTLLQKREEISLSLAATANSAKVFDEAMIMGKVAPRTRIVLLVALLAGILLPAGMIYLIDMIRYKVQSRDDVERICKVPVLAEIPHYKGKEHIVVKEDRTDEMDEAFRMVCTNLMFTLGRVGKVVTFTSTVSGEGKTFIAINSAMSMALLGKKVLLAELDLRIPQLKEYFGLDTDEGITLYLAGFEKEIRKLIIPSGIHANLDLLPAGPVPPNPAELLNRPTLESAFSKLREEYDYIFIDSAPLGQVSDTQLVNRVSDANLYVCRVDYSQKNNLLYANELMEKGKLNNMFLVVNDLKKHQQKYGYGYGYGHEGRKGKKKRVQGMTGVKRSQKKPKGVKRLNDNDDRKRKPPLYDG